MTKGRVLPTTVLLSIFIPTLARGDDGALERETRLETVLGRALARNPELMEAEARAAAAAASAESAGSLPDPELKGEVWGVPLSAPAALDRSQMLMIGLRQAFPAWGSLDARERAARESIGSAEEARRARERDVAAGVKRTFASLWRAETEYRVHLEHMGLLSRLVELSRAHYQAGRGSQQDLLRLTVELGELHTDVANLEQEIASSRSLLNTYMGRAPAAPLGPAALPPALASPAEARDAPPPSKLEAAAEARPEVAAAGRALRRSEALLDAARSAARYPALMIGADYWNMPMSPDRHAYAAMVTVSLPWLNPRHRHEVRAAERTVAADRRALEAQRSLARFEAHDAGAKLEAARRSLAILDGDLLPQARRSFESAQAAYTAGQGNALALIDAQRAYLQVRLQRSRAAARVAAAAADHERALAGGAAAETARGDRR